MSTISWNQKISICKENVYNMSLGDEKKKRGAYDVYLIYFPSPHSTVLTFPLHPEGPHS
jgi:hypothetical protein